MIDYLVAAASYRFKFELAEIIFPVGLVQYFQLVNSRKQSDFITVFGRFTIEILPFEIS